MDTDYILIAVDPEAKFAIRFLSFAHGARESLELQTPGAVLSKPYLEFVLSGMILGSRMDDQEATLFKFQLSEQGLSINCEVTPRGALRSAIFPHESRDPKTIDWTGLLKVVRLKKGDETYESVVEIKKDGVVAVFRDYLDSSVQTPSIFLVSADADDVTKNYALWIEKLPDTSLADWDAFKTLFDGGARFYDAIRSSNDPDVIVQKLFDTPIRILAVTKPKLVCSCSRDRIIDALRVLSLEDLTEIYMDGGGVTTFCDYCRQEFEITDEEIKALLNIPPTMQ